MRFCSRCGAGNTEEAAFCSECGTALKEDGAQTAGVELPQQNLGVPMYPPQMSVPLMTTAVPVVSTPKSDGMCIISLVLGISSFFICPIIFGILAIVFGRIGQKNVAASRGLLGGDSMARAGVILGIINIAFSMLVIVIGMIAAASSHAAVLGLGAVAMGLFS